MSVVAFKRPETIDPHLSGQAVCIACRYEWVAAAPVGVWNLECPECGTMKGLYRAPVAADVGDEEFRCVCGCEALTAYRRKGLFHIVCMNCGLHQTEALFGD